MPNNLGSQLFSLIAIACQARLAGASGVAATYDAEYQARVNSLPPKRRDAADRLRILAVSYFAQVAEVGEYSVLHTRDVLFGEVTSLNEVPYAEV